MTMATGTTGGDTSGDGYISTTFVRVQFIGSSGILVGSSDHVFTSRRVLVLSPVLVEPAREFFRRIGDVDVDVVARQVIPVVHADYDPVLPILVTGWLSPHHCGLHGARVQARIQRAGGGRWRTRAVEVRRRQPGARATRRRPQAAIVKQVRKALRRMARETGR